MKSEMIDITLQWTWIKDKQIDIEGNRYRGLIIISDKDDNILKIYGYELVQYEEGDGDED